ncbi:MAG: thiosulfate oxidation carrier protein SoxY [Rhodospirillales bacterium]|nr:thiosulfate oxidation carrier protein SoxY [Rhodospirillales bacterium]
MQQTKISRRRILSAAGGAIALATIGAPLSDALANPKDAKKKLAEITGGAKAKKGRVHVELPALSDQGPLVPIGITVDSPMTDDDYVSEVHIIATRNTSPDVAVFHFTPLSGRAEVATRIRVRESQIVTVAAKMNDGSVYVGKARSRIVGGAGGCG